MAYTSRSTQSTGHVVTATEWNESVNNDIWANEIKNSTRVYNSAVVSIGTSGTAQALLFDSERYDNGGMHSTVSNTGRITIPTGGTGLYFIGGSVGFAANATGYRQLHIRQNGSTILAVQAVPAVSGSPTYLTVNTLYRLAAADYVELIVTQTSGGALNTVAAASYSPEFWCLWMST